MGFGALDCLHEKIIRQIKKKIKKSKCKGSLLAALAVPQIFLH